ncbi:hypothetical protein [Shimia abyssi]|uniref:Uncharacterized protein n=1 Tax=Shimia abyssi TaxID=1662395 RepID=A0A2P8FAW2_9RHOB|nr:hypothetical protein [Shimia abyssi]PSL18865.1 hypothetical protein CLV88_10843 [Shimia abyssi]
MSLGQASTSSAPPDTDDSSTVFWIYAVLAAVVVAWGSAIFVFGVPGLYIPAVALVPLIWTVLIIITRG